MIKEILKLISEGKTIYEISRIMEMDYSAVVGMLQHMVKMGLLETRERDEREASMCRSCPLYGVCSKRELKIYYITEKGRKLIMG